MSYSQYVPLTNMDGIERKDNYGKKTPGHKKTFNAITNGTKRCFKVEGYNFENLPPQPPPAPQPPPRTATVELFSGEIYTRGSYKLTITGGERYEQSYSTPIEVNSVKFQDGSAPSRLTLEKGGSSVSFTGSVERLAGQGGNQTRAIFEFT